MRPPRLIAVRLGVVRVLPLLAASLTLACGTTEGRLLHARDAGPAPWLDAAPGTAGERAPLGDSATRVSPGMRLQYQVSGELDLSVSADAYVSDMFDTEPAQIAELHGAGRIALAYFSAGSFEPWRPDAGDFDTRAIGSPLAGYPNEHWLDVRSSNVRAIMQARLQLARSKGFDGVFPGALGGSAVDSGFPLSDADQADYDLFLASEARTLQLTPGLSVHAMFSPQLAAAFDWAITFGCLAADSCEQLQPFVARDKAVFDLETSGDLSELCPQAAALGIALSLKRQNYDAWSKPCP